MKSVFDYIFLLPVGLIVFIKYMGGKMHLKTEMVLVATLPFAHFSCWHTYDS